jgi:hypothetical protein
MGHELLVYADEFSILGANENAVNTERNVYWSLETKLGKLRVRYIHVSQTE